MAQDGEINLKEVKAKYSVRDIILVDSRELDFVNEVRLYYEISFAIGLTLLGSLVNNFNINLLITTIIFLGFGIFNLIRYIIRNKKLKNKEKANINN